MNKSLKRNTGKYNQKGREVFKEETNKSLKNIQGITIKQVKEIKLQDLNMEIEAMKETKSEGILEMENLGKRTGATDASISTEYRRWKRESQA